MSVLKGVMFIVVQHYLVAQFIRTKSILSYEREKLYMSVLGVVFIELQNHLLIECIIKESVLRKRIQIRKRDRERDSERGNM